MRLGVRSCLLTILGKLDRAAGSFLRLRDALWGLLFLFFEPGPLWVRFSCSAQLAPMQLALLAAQRHCLCR